MAKEKSSGVNKNYFLLFTPEQPILGGHYEKNIDPTFLADDIKDKNAIRKIMQLGHSFTMAIAENNSDLAEKIRQEAIALKNEIGKKQREVKG